MNASATRPSGRGKACVAACRDALPTYWLVVPCRNEARNLETLLPLLLARLTRLAERWEVVMVDDGSTDDTAAVMLKWAVHPGFRAVQLSRNFGKEAALTAGLEQSRARS